MEDGVDKRYMRVALRLALKGAGTTSPNPLVGAVVVRGGKIIATGYHRLAGEDHAEIVALKQAGSRAKGATLYLNLEPCSHYGKTPPCTNSIVLAGVREVVAGMVDPNPRVSGRGIRKLRGAGIRVRVGILEEECRRLNEAFSKYITQRLPFVILKLAASLDGKIATSTGHSRWVTGESCRQYVHKLRNQVDAVLVGVGTVIADNPQLTCRVPGGRDPWRLVLDGHLRIPLSAKLLHQRAPEKNIIVTGLRSSRTKIREIRELGAQVWRFPPREGKIPWTPLLNKLAAMGILSVMIEGGGTTASGALLEKRVDKILFFYAPKIIGGDGKAMVEALGVKAMRRCRQVTDLEVRKFGKDFLVSGYL